MSPEPGDPAKSAELAGRRAVLKLGGEVVADRGALRHVLTEVCELRAQGWRFAIVHGGGPQAGELQRRLGLRPRKVAGRRITDQATLRVMKQAVAGEVSVDLVAEALGVGLDALGLSGVGGRLIRARRRPVTSVPEAGNEVVDYGFVGEIEEIRTDIVEILWGAGLTPVINPLGIEGSPAAAGAPQVFNINADTVASRLAEALRADHLFLVTSVPGVLRDRGDPTTRIPRLSATQARQAIDDGTIAAGMIPKVLDVLGLLGRAVGAVHILAPGPGALRSEAQQPGRRGTALLPDPPGTAGGPPSLDPLHDPRTK